MISTARATLVLVLLALLGPSNAIADKAWMKEEGYKRLLRGEVKALKPLLEQALKADYRRQAWYLADRIVAADPEDSLAVETLEKWDAGELQLGAPLKKAFVKKLANALRGVGDSYFSFGETLEAAGVDPIEYYPINLRAQSYGSQAGPLIASMQQGGYAWLGTYGHEEQATVDKLLGPELAGSVHYPPEWDDGYLAFRASWPECRIVEWNGWRVVTDHKYDQALRALKRVADVERWIVKKLGKGKRLDETVTVALFRDRAGYMKYGKDLVRKRYRDPLVLSTGLWIDTYYRAFVADTDARNEWLGEFVTLQGMVARAMARTRYAKTEGARVTGRGEWILEGMRGVGESLRYTDEEKGAMALDLKSSWRLAAARALRDAEAHVPWAEMLTATEKGRLAAERPESTRISLGGTIRDAKAVDKIAAQGAVFVLAVVQYQKKKGPKALTKMLVDLHKQGAIDEPWGYLKWKPIELVMQLENTLKKADPVESE